MPAVAPTLLDVVSLSVSEDDAVEGSAVDGEEPEGDDSGEHEVPPGQSTPLAPRCQSYQGELDLHEWPPRSATHSIACGRRTSATLSLLLQRMTRFSDLVAFVIGKVLRFIFADNLDASFAQATPPDEHRNSEDDAEGAVHAIPTAKSTARGKAKGKAKGEAKGKAKAKAKSQAVPAGSESTDTVAPDAAIANAKAKGKAKPRAKSKSAAAAGEPAVATSTTAAKAKAASKARPKATANPAAGGEAGPADEERAEVADATAAQATEDGSVLATVHEGQDDIEIGDNAHKVYCSNCKCWVSYKRCRVLSKHAGAQSSTA